ncbi:hypothetical protein BJF77_02350 [Kocuria sp. CNJ-770]|uniref:hypothetical protein n=1 Tax=Kocuria sp. CNJ-770 TaxID=1904964 RepID=UPI000964BCFD|nr:hypothetical protein [Kocuria sp. CNJ-770]OLT07149.1 hypothetical protein BJF77_02350 [Kocuria sp. CNJ-770]
MFSHPAPEPIEPTGPSAAAPGEPALDGRWRAATAGWRPSSIRAAGPERVWAWVRHAWEALLAPPAAGDDDGAVADEGAPGRSATGTGPRVDDLLTVAALLALQERFLAVAAGEPAPAEVPDPRRDGAALSDDEVLTVVRRTWEIDPAEAGADAFAAELSGFLQDHLDEQAEEVRERLLDRRGPTQLFAELWSLEHVDELEPAAEQDAAPPFPLSTDDIAWIVSGVPGPEKHTAWGWLTR